jgi:hypothetical protein
MKSVTIKFVQPFTSTLVTMRVTCDGRKADFCGRRDGTWKDLAAIEADYAFLAAVLDNHKSRIADVFESYMGQK